MLLSFCPDVFVFVILACQEVCLQIPLFNFKVKCLMFFLWLVRSQHMDDFDLGLIFEHLIVPRVLKYSRTHPSRGRRWNGNVNWGMPETHTGASDVRCARSEYETGHCFWDFCVWFQVSSDWDVVKVCQKLKCRLLFESTHFLSQMHLENNAAKWGLWIMNMYELQNIFGTG